MKNLTVNCGNIALLNDRENVMEKYDSVIFNCGNFYVSSSVHARLMEKNATFNCGNTSIMNAPQNPVRYNGLFTVSGEDFTGVYPVCEKALVTAEGMAALARMEGMLVLGTLYYPQDSGAIPPTVQAGKLVPYPAQAKAVIDDAWLTPEAGGVWLKNTQYFVSGTVYALDAGILANLKAQGTSFHCGNLYLYEGMLPEYGAMFTSASTTLIPDGYAFAKEGAPLLDLYATYGKKIYLLGDLTVQPGEVKHLARFESILVRKTANLPMAHLDECEKVIKAKKVSLFEGELLDVNGFQTLAHDMLAAANAQDIRYTVKVNGFLLIGEEVTIEDVRAIAALKINGAVSAPTVTHAQLSRVTGKVNGALLPSIAELKKMAQDAPGGVAQTMGSAFPAPVAKMLGVDVEEGNNSVINCGNYILV